MNTGREGILWRLGERGKHVAQKVSVTFACDYDSREIPNGEHLTRSFSLDGRDYEIDLCEKHSQKFDETMRRFADKARRVTSMGSRTKPRPAPPPPPRPQTKTRTNPLA